jgi:hypothetical protein
MDNEDSILIDPKTLESKPIRNERTPRAKTKEIIPAEDTKFYNRGGRVTVKFESNGRFSAPPEMYFTDYSVEHVNDLTLSTLETIYETLISIMDRIKNPDAGVSITELTIEEFLEALVGIKLQFNTYKHIHRWIDDCQINASDKERKISEVEIDLRTIQYRSIEQAELDLRKFYKENYFDEWTDEEFKEYLINRYAEEPLDDIDTWTREQELETIMIKEPINYKHPDTGNLYSFKLMRVGDLLEAQKLIRLKYDPKIRIIKNRPNPHGVMLLEVQEQKEREIQAIKENEAKEAILYAQAMTLIKFNGKEISSHEERYELFKELTRGDQFDFSDFLSHIQFGIYDERELTCNLCGKPSKRLLQQEFTPIELLPLDIDTQRAHRKRARGTIYFGV